MTVEEEHKKKFGDAYEAMALKMNESIAEMHIGAGMTISVLATILGRMVALTAENEEQLEDTLGAALAMVAECCGLERQHGKSAADYLRDYALRENKNKLS